MSLCLSVVHLIRSWYVLHCLSVLPEHIAYCKANGVHRQKLGQVASKPEQGGTAKLLLLGQRLGERLLQQGGARASAELMFDVSS